MMFGGGFDLNAWQAADAAIVQQHTTGLSSSSSSCFQSSLPSADSQQASRGPFSRLGDWACDECRNVNFAKRTRCNKCGARKRAPQPGTTESDNGGVAGSAVDDARQQPAQQQSRAPLFKAGDWHCTHCGNVNWARRTKCNVCNGPKPNQDDEPRMGRGGGHFDLQNPEDRLSHDSEDEEYDEFGRKKKRRRTTGSATITTTVKAFKPPGHLSSTPTEEEEDEFDTTATPAARAAPTETNTSANPSTNLDKTAGTAPLSTALYFPPPPACFLRGRTRSMASVSSTSSDYEEIDDDDS